MYNGDEKVVKGDEGRQRTRRAPTGIVLWAVIYDFTAMLDAVVSQRE